MSLVCSHYGLMDAYSEDLRRKIVEEVEQRRMTKSEAARAFGVSLSSVKRYVKAVREGRSLSPGKAPGKRPSLDVDRPGIFLLSCFFVFPTSR